METLSDFGSVSFFGISTFTTGIYNAWISFDDLTLANRLSFYLLIFILGLFVLENFQEKKLNITHLLKVDLNLNQLLI